jgi:hypothetical protein
VLPAPQDAPAAIPSAPAEPQPEAVRPAPNAIVRIPDVPVPHDPVRIPIPPQVDLAPEPRPAQPDLLTSPILPPLRPFEFLQVRVPFLRTVAELEREDLRQELVDALGRDHAAYRLDLFVRDTARGAAVFQRAANAAGLKVFADAATLEKLKKHQVASVVVYVENLTAAELGVLFGKLAAEDAKFSPRICDSLHAAPLITADASDLEQVLGVDAGLFKRPRTSGGTGQGTKLERTAEPKSISAGTIDSVVKAVTKPDASAADKNENTAVLMTWQSSTARTPPAMSVELQQFLSKRSDRRVNAVPTIIVIRTKG